MKLLPRLVISLAVVVIQCAASSPAAADVIDFGGLNGGFQAPMTPYREGTFRVTPVTTDTWFEGHGIGNPVPDIFARPLNSPNHSVFMLTRVETFMFTALDFSSNFGASDLTIEGFLGAASVFTQNESHDNGAYNFQSIPNVSPSTVIDRLRITVNPISALSINIDNIQLSGGLIDFGGLNGAVQSPFHLYNEGAFTVNPLTPDDWLEGHLVGNPVPNIFTRTPASFEITRTGTFAFTSLEYSSNFGTSTYTFEGYRGGGLVASQTGTANSPGYDFKTINSSFPSETIDRLFVTTDQLDSISVNVDNINVSPVNATVPEPAALALFASALICRAVTGRRRRRA
jgi:hypothetical protein